MKENTNLEGALKSGDIAVVKGLLNSGGNLQNLFYEQRNDLIFNFFMNHLSNLFVIGSDYVDPDMYFIVKELLTYGGDVNYVSQTHGRTNLLWHAVELGDVDFMVFLLIMGADYANYLNIYGISSMNASHDNSIDAGLLPTYGARESLRQNSKKELQFT